MKITPILFSTPMVQAILAKRKGQTRRIMNDQPHMKESNFIAQTAGWPSLGDFAVKTKISGTPDRYEVLQVLKNKYRVGDILWVRETWLQIHKDVELEGRFSEYVYRADEEANEKKFGHIKNPVGKRFIDSWKWKPSIFMPKEAARIFLKVTNVRAERLQDITDADAIAEGIDGSKSDGFVNYCFPGARTCAQVSFESLWISINGSDTWKLNPWVWVYEFEQIEKPNDFLS